MNYNLNYMHKKEIYSLILITFALILSTVLIISIADKFSGYNDFEYSQEDLIGNLVNVKNYNANKQVYVAGLNSNQSNVSSIASLNFDEGAGSRTIDTSSNTQLVITNPKWVNGLDNNGKALEFSGGVRTGRYSYVNANKKDIKNDITIKALIKLNSKSGTQVIADNNYNYALWLENGFPVCGVFDRTRGMLSVKSNKLLETNKVLDLTCSYDHKNGKLKVYVDNTEQASKDVKVSNWVNGGNLIIGNGYRVGYLAGQFQGVIDNVVIENKLFVPSLSAITNPLGKKLVTNVSYLKDFSGCGSGFIPMQIISEYQSACKLKNPDKSLEAFSKWAENLMCLSPKQMDFLDNNFADYVSALNNKDAACTVNLALPIIDLAPRHSLPDSFEEFEKRFNNKNSYQEMKNEFPNEIGLLFVDYEDVEVKRMTHDCKIVDNKLECQPLFNKIKNAFGRLENGLDNCYYSDTAMNEFICNEGIMCNIKELLEDEIGHNLGSNQFLVSNLNYLEKENQFQLGASFMPENEKLNSGLYTKNAANKLCAINSDSNDDLDNSDITNILSGHENAGNCGLFDGSEMAKQKIKGELEKKAEFFECWKGNPEVNQNKITFSHFTKVDPCIESGGGSGDIDLEILKDLAKKTKDKICNRGFCVEYNSKEEMFRLSISHPENSVENKPRQIMTVDDLKQERGGAVEDENIYLKDRDYIDPDGDCWGRCNNPKWKGESPIITLDGKGQVKECLDGNKCVAMFARKEANQVSRDVSVAKQRAIDARELADATQTQKDKDAADAAEKQAREVEEDARKAEEDARKAEDVATSGTPSPDGDLACMSASEKRALAKALCIAKRHIGEIAMPTEITISGQNGIQIPVETTRPPDSPDATTSCASAVINRNPSNINDYIKDQCEKKAQCAEGENCCGNLFEGITRFPPERRSEPDPIPPWNKK